MDKSQPFSKTTTEHESEDDTEITDLPELDTKEFSPVSWISHKVLNWQRSIAQHPRRWRLLSILSTGILLLAIVVIIGNSIAMSIAPHPVPVSEQPANNFVFSTRPPFNPFRYPHTDQPAAVYKGLKGPAENLAWSPDGKYFAGSGGIDDKIGIWDSHTRKEIVSYNGHTDDVLGLVWSPDGKSIATASRDKTIQIWNSTTGKLQSIIHNDLPVFSVAWSPNGREIAFGDDAGRIQLWDLQTNLKTAIWTGQIAAIFSLAWSPDGTKLASGSLDRTVVIRQVSDGQILWHYNHGDAVSTVRWSPDGKYLASGSFDTTVEVWNIQIKVLVRQYREHDNAILALAWSPDGKYIASSSNDETIQIMSLASGLPTMIYMTDTISVDWSPDGKLLVSGSHNGVITTWRT